MNVPSLHHSDSGLDAKVTASSFAPNFSNECKNEFASETRRGADPFWILFKSDPHRSRVDATDMDPIQSSADVKGGFCVQEILVFNNENKPRFASAPVLDRIRASPLGPERIRSKLVRLFYLIQTSTDSRPKLVRQMRPRV